jgi:hypothetical protein
MPDQTTTMIHPDQPIATDIPFQWNKLPEELKRYTVLCYTAKAELQIRTYQSHTGTDLVLGVKPGA